jgi:hypothetical protein
VIDVSTTIVDGAGHGAKVVGTQVVDCVKKRPEPRRKSSRHQRKTEMVSMLVLLLVTAGAAIIGSAIAAIAPVIGAAEPSPAQWRVPLTLVEVAG